MVPDGVILWPNHLTNKSDSMLKKEIQKLAKQFYQDTVKQRRHLHQNPELSFQEKKTAAYVAKQLKAWGIPHQTGVAGYGVVGIIKGKKTSKRTIALRGDMDALPIQEANEVSYKSKNDGVMHACGHDVHTASLLSAARILNELKDQLAGTIKLFFQPAEERFPGGASLMIDEGALEKPKPSSIYGQHVHPPLETGKVGFCPGQYMASADEMYMTVKGRGGHGALPQDCIDPLIITSHIVLALQQVVSRMSNPTMPTVLTFGKIWSDGGSTNVIPNKIKLEGTFRTMDEKWRKKAHKLMKKMAKKIANSMGGACKLDIKYGYPSLYNNPELTMRSKKWAIEYLGADNVVDLPIRMTAEDFSYFSQQMPACFYRLGTGNKSKGITSPVHTNTFDIDEKALLVGAGLMAYLAVQELANG